MATFKQPEKFDFRNPRWEQWRSTFETFHLISDLGKKSQKVQIATLKYCMGEESEEIIRTFDLSEEESKNYELVLNKFDTYFKPRKNVLRYRKKFHQRLQHEDEDIEAYLRALYSNANDCEFVDKKERIRDQFVAGITDDQLAERLEHLYLSDEVSFTLEKMIEYARSYIDVTKSRKKEK